MNQDLDPAFYHQRNYRRVPKDNDILRCEFIFSFYNLLKEK